MRSRSTWYVLQLGPSKRNEGKKLFELPFRMDQKTGSPSAMPRVDASCQIVPTPNTCAGLRFIPLSPARSGL
jgi:hypothetical protein